MNEESLDYDLCSLSRIGTICPYCKESAWCEAERAWQQGPYEVDIHWLCYHHDCMHHWWETLYYDPGGLQ